MTDTSLEETAKVCQAAFYAEHSGQFAEALKLHHTALVALEKVIHDGKVFTTEPVRRAKMQLKVHQLRCQVLRTAAAQNTSPAFLLPTAHGARDELLKGCLSADENFRRLWSTITPRPPQPPREFSHLFQKPIPPFASSLDTGLPQSTYYIQVSTDMSVVSGGVWLKFKAKREQGGPDVYVMQAVSRKRIQNTSGAFYRASDLLRPIIEVRIEPLRGRPTPTQLITTGRPIHIRSGTHYRKELPDRFKKIAWTPRRFDYGGRRFVWKQERPTSSTIEESLYEVEKEWAKPGSKTGKKEDQTLQRKLMWSTVSFGSKYHILHFAGGLDQLFVESLLASQMARMFAKRQSD